MAQLKDIMAELPKSTDPHAGSLLQKVGNDIKELDGNTIASAYNLSALSGMVESSVEDLQESIDNHSLLLFEIDQSKASKEYVNNAIENYTFTASYHTGSSTQDTTWEQFSAAISSGQYKKFECQVFGDAEAYLLKNMYEEVTADGVDYTFSGSVRDKNYSVKFSQLHPAGGVLEVTESAGGLSSVAHDSTLTGDGTSANPLSVVGGGRSQTFTAVCGEAPSSTPKTTWLEFLEALGDGYEKIVVNLFITSEEVIVLDDFRANETEMTFDFTGVFDNKLYRVRFSSSSTYGDVDVSNLGGGSGGPSTLFKTVADMQAASLNVGDVVETQRFYPFAQRVFDDDQPGGCQYRIINNPSSTDLSEGLGKDLIQLNNGLYAKANLFNEAYPEQIGYKIQYGPTNGVDLTPYIQRLARIGVTHIKLHRTGHYNGPDSQNAVYRIKDKCELTRSIRISGTHASSSGYSTYISFTPSASNTDKVMFECKKRDIIFEDLVLNNPSTTDISDNGTCIKISDDGSGRGTNSLGNQFYRLNIQQFKYGIYGASGFLWHVSVDHCVWANNYINVRLERIVYTMKFYNCLFNNAHYRSIEVGSPFTLQFDTCNFGVKPSNDCLLHVERWNSPAEQPPVNERYGGISFINSQLEYEEAGEDVSADVGKGKFVYCEDDAITSLFFTNCLYINTPLARANNYAVRLFSLGENSTVSFKGCLGPLSDVDITTAGHENYFLEKDFDKLFFDESRPCRKIVGGISVERCYGIDPLPLIPDSHLSSVVVDGRTILTSNNTDIGNYYKVAEGTQMLNLDEKKVQMFAAGKLVNINTLPSNLVRIGKELYEYVTIDGRLWITRNLNLRTPNRNNTFWNHLNFGQYYHTNDIVNIESKLPSGWRIPLDADINSICGDGSASRARALQSRDYPSVWGNATNSLGFNMTPSHYWKRPSQASESNFNVGFLFGQLTSGGRRNIWLKENGVLLGGWGTNDLRNLYVPVRVCADA